MKTLMILAVSSILIVGTATAQQPQSQSQIQSQSQSQTQIQAPIPQRPLPSPPAPRFRTMGDIPVQSAAMIQIGLNSDAMTKLYAAAQQKRLTDVGALVTAIVQAEIYNITRQIPSNDVLAKQQALNQSQQQDIQNSVAGVTVTVIPQAPSNASSSSAAK